MPRPPRSAPPVSREVIVQTALDLLESDGYDNLSLARIAAALGVQTPALYWYFRSRAELYSVLAETLFRETLAAIPPELTGRALLAAYGHALRCTLTSRRDAARLAWLVSPTDAVGAELIPALLGRLTAGGFAPTQAMRAQIAMQSLALGWATFELNPPVADAMGRAVDADAAFAEAVATLAQNFPASAVASSRDRD